MAWKSKEDTKLKLWGYYCQRNSNMNKTLWPRSRVVDSQVSIKMVRCLFCRTTWLAPSCWCTPILPFSAPVEIRTHGTSCSPSILWHCCVLACSSRSSSPTFLQPPLQSVLAVLLVNNLRGVAGEVAHCKEYKVWRWQWTGQPPEIWGQLQTELYFYYCCSCGQQPTRPLRLFSKGINRH